jgi:hypothetical protein
MGFSLCPERGHEGRTHEVPQEDRCSSMYINFHALSSYICTHSHCNPLISYLTFGYLSLPLLHVQNLIRNSNWSLFFAG